MVIDGVSEQVLSVMLKKWKLSIFNLADKRIKFYSHKTNLLPPKPKSSLRHMKLGIQTFHRKYVLVPANKAANYIVVVCRLHYIYTLKQELNGTKAYEETSTDEKTVVNSHLNALPHKFAVNSNERHDKLLRCIGYLSFTKDCIKLDSLPTIALALQQNCLNYQLLESRVIRYYEKCMKGQGKICFGL